MAYAAILVGFDVRTGVVGLAAITGVFNILMPESSSSYEISL